jgi:hypothetical protein
MSNIAHTTRATVNVDDDTGMAADNESCRLSVQREFGCFQVENQT